MKISQWCTHPQGILGVYDLLDESNRSYIKNGPGPSKPYNGDKRVLFVNSPEDVKYSAHIRNKTCLTRLRGVNKGLL